ncbi:MAG: retropepsin-like aspartic protease [Planctomycetota bacterium]|nr:retropepsin-like aspartic protease [Planctomycetota bacterium]
MRALLVVPLLVLGCQTAAPAVDPSAEVLAPIRRSIGMAERGAGDQRASLRGVRERHGASIPIELSFWPEGAFRSRIGDGAAVRERGFNGREAWVTDERGVTRAQSLGSGEYLILEGWARTQQWLSGPGGRRWSASEDPAAPHTLRLTHRSSGALAAVRLDPATSRPAQVTWQRHGQTRSLALEDWTERDGRWLPMTVTESVAGEVSFVDRFKTRGRPAGPAVRRPTSSPSDVVFSARGGPLPRSDLRFDRGGRTFVKALIDDQHEAWMLLDTGFGSHAISKDLAETLALQSASSVALRGVGGEATTGRRRGETLRVGEATLQAPTFVELDTSFLSDRAGFTVDGVLGAPLFDRAVVVIDDLRGLVEVHDPDRFDDKHLAWQQVRFDATAPCVPGQIRANGEETPPLWFRLDTGSDDTVTVSRWAVRAHGLAGDRAGLAPRRLAGPFGQVEGWRTTASVVLMAGANRGRQVITLMRDDVPGPLSDPWIAGNLGTRLLRGQRCVLDLRFGRVALTSRGEGDSQ